MSCQKRTTYDLCKKMRDEVSYVANRMYFLVDRIGSDSLRSDFKSYVHRLNDLVDNISLVPRNCDIGTAEEQVKRYRKFCGTYDRCEYCPIKKDGGILSAMCFARWAQMQYEKEGEA